MTETTIVAVTGDRADLGGPAVASVLAEIIGEGGPQTDGDFNALAMFLIDFALAGDTESLRALQDWLRYERAQLMASADDNRSELEGRLLGLIDASHWAMERALPLSDLAGLEPGSHAISFVGELSVHPGLNSNELAARLGVDDSEVSRVGKRLRTDGMVLYRKLGRQKLWELTPKGRRSLEMVNGVVQKPGSQNTCLPDGGQLNAAIVEDSRLVSALNEAVVSAVSGAITALIDKGKLKVAEISEGQASFASTPRRPAKKSPPRATATTGKRAPQKASSRSKSLPTRRS